MTTTTMREDFAPVQQRLMEFVRREFRPGYNHYNVSKLIGDASSRQYFRYVTDFEKSYILAVYPEPFDPESFTYRQVYELLKEICLPVPEILQMDGALGIVLQEDLGNQTLQKYFMTCSSRDRDRLLRLAIEYMIRIQKEGSRAISPHFEGYRLAFDEEKLNWEFGFFRRHYLGNYRQLKLEGEEGLMAELARIARELAACPRVLCHRDYHIRNLMFKDSELYVIDFQDARWGPISYDLASLLKDSIDLPETSVRELADYFLSLSDWKESRDAFFRQFHLMSVQRLLKALGTYGYQVIVRENFIYEQYMKGSLHRALDALRSLPEFPLTERLIQQELDR